MTYRERQSSKFFISKKSVSDFSREGIVLINNRILIPRGHRYNHYYAVCAGSAHQGYACPNTGIVPQTLFGDTVRADDRDCHTLDHAKPLPAIEARRDCRVLRDRVPVHGNADRFVLRDLMSGPRSQRAGFCGRRGCCRWWCEDRKGC